VTETPNVTVITSIIDGRDHLREDQRTGGARFVAYVNAVHDTTTWEQRPAYDGFLSARRNSRAHKILSHQFCDTVYCIWIDGNVALRIEPASLVQKVLGRFDFAVFKHPERSCIYEESDSCILRGLDDPAIIRRQMAKYANNGYEHDQGLAEANVIIRRHTKPVIEFNNSWWAEYCSHSVRDQISFMYAAAQVGLRINWLSPTVFTGNPDFHGVAHVTA